jgi:hypothetical protein
MPFLYPSPLALLGLIWWLEAAEVQARRLALLRAAAGR